jgi:regulator of sigma E protease
MCGVKVLEFSMGMGPLLWQKRKGETLYSVRLLPIGGYCMMDGDDADAISADDGGTSDLDDEAAGEPAVPPEDDPRSFLNAAAWKKLIILFAGAVMNILIAFILVAIVVTYIGLPTLTLSRVEKGQPAYEAGIRTGDTITAVDGRKTDDWSSAVQSIQKSSRDGSVVITVDRDGKSRSITVEPEKNDDGTYVIGVTAGSDHNFFRCLGRSAQATWNLNSSILEGFRQLFTGQLSSSDVSGPVGMVRMVNQTAHYGLLSFLMLTAFVSLNLAIFNLLPIPALDGGRILFVLLGKLSRGRINENTERVANAIGFGLLMLLIVFVTWNDIAGLLGK